MDQQRNLIQSGGLAVHGCMRALELARPGVTPSRSLRARRPFLAWDDRMAKEAPVTGVDHSRLIVAVAQAADRGAFTALFEHFAPRIKAFLMRGGSDDALADELAQETLLAVWRKAASFDPSRATAATWIFTIARNLRVDRYRKEWRGVAAGDDLPDTVDERAAPDEELSGGERDERVRRALRTLPPDQVKVIELSFFEETPHAEIAKALGIPLGTVKSRIRIAMTKLRALLDELS
ncbi:MAG: sigma-70 family RNA polymerase sigma factor [Pseudolabrys sp.]